MGSVVAPHNEHDDGEVRGLNYKGFQGNQFDGEGRGKSLWVGLPARGCSRIIVAESFISGLSAWEMLPEPQRMITGIVSTGGNLAAAGAERLGRAVEWLRGQTATAGEEIMLLDASDVHEARTATRAMFLSAECQRRGVRYQRWAPHGETQDWNDALVVSKGHVPYQDTCSSVHNAPEDTEYHYNNEVPALRQDGEDEEPEDSHDMTV